MPSRARTLGPLLASALLSAACVSHGARGTSASREQRRTIAVRDSVATVLTAGLADSAFPAAWAVVGTAESIYASFGVGQIEPVMRPSVAPAMGSGPSDVASTAPLAGTPVAGTPVSDSTVWDLASLTKVVGTTSAVLQLVADGRVPAIRYLPRWRAPRADEVTIRHLLTHSAGLPAWRPLYKEAWSAEEAIAQVYATGPDTTPGARYVYSDLGFILLGEVVREVSGLPLDSYVLSRVFLPLGMRETRFLPSPFWQSRTAPTEVDPWRQRHVRGEVHDENAFQLGQVSGHAGLFTTARDLTRFAQMLTRGGWTRDERGRRVTVLPEETLRRFRARQPLPGSHRALGWETPTGTNSAGRRLSAEAFGHTGFTGTSLWVDPQRGVFVLLLTNRVNPTRQRSGIAGVRTRLADAVVGALEAADR
ncbi:MAG: beta-lactamase family protein [Gemmatimonadaceae bacterium]|nr:beta-lactamase family protein [Gemmatimonadaceae bacterium]